VWSGLRCSRSGYWELCEQDFGARGVAIGNPDVSRLACSNACYLIRGISRVRVRVRVWVWVRVRVRVWVWGVPSLTGTTVSCVTTLKVTCLQSSSLHLQLESSWVLSTIAAAGDGYAYVFLLLSSCFLVSCTMPALSQEEEEWEGDGDDEVKGTFELVFVLRRMRSDIPCIHVSMQMYVAHVIGSHICYRLTTHPLFCDVTRPMFFCDVTHPMFFCDVTHPMFFCDVTHPMFFCDVTHPMFFCDVTHSPFFCDVTRATAGKGLSH
jgi:hypothetical protein